MATFYGKRTEEDPQAMLTDIPAAAEEEEHMLSTQQVIGEKEISRAAKILTDYKAGKANLEERVVQDELWFKLRHWEVIRKGQKADENPQPEPSSAWLFNAILNKHADAMDNYPEPIVLPRERSDEESARTLSSILPVIMEYNGFEQTYSDAWWDKLKDGTAVYGVFWDPEKDDIEIRQIDILKIFWEPGITNIQDSQNLFIVDLVDQDVLKAQYPEIHDALKGMTINVKDYIYDESIDNSNKTLLVDWYYKVRTEDGRTVLHYCKFCGNHVLYASENDPQYQDTGWYTHGMYPVVFDGLYPEKSTPVSFGLVSVCKNPQLYIDKLSANIMENSMMGTKKRFFISSSTGVNEKEFLDWNKPLVHVEGELGEERIREITTQPLSATYENVLQMKIEEMKDTSANRDVNQGSTGGVSAASAIAALQEAGNKSSRDMIAASYRSYAEIVKLCIELIRQFYDEARAFRVTGQMPGQYDFVTISNLYLKDQVTGQDSFGNDLYRKPIFDLKIKAQKKNPFSKMEENERAKELYSLGFFNPERAQEALGALEMMDFEGIDKVRENVQQGQTLLNMVQQMSAQMQQMSAMLGAMTGIPMTGSTDTATGAGPQINTGNPVSEQDNPDGAANNKVASGVMQASTPMTSYGNRLAKRSKPDMNAGSVKDLAK